MLPVMAGLCRYESLKDGSLDMADIALMNDALAVRNDNDWLESEHRAKENRHG